MRQAVTAVQKMTVSSHLRGEEGLSEAQFHTSETALEVLRLLVEQLPDFEQNFLLRGGCALYHTEHAHGLFRRGSNVSAVLRWTADVDLEMMAGDREQQVDAIVALLMAHGFKVRGEAMHQKSFATVISMKLESPEGYETTLDVLDAYRSCALTQHDGAALANDTSISWDNTARIRVRTQSIEEIVAKKLVIRFYHQFRPQDALDLFFAFSFMRLNPQKLRAAFLAELALWGADQHIVALIVQDREGVTALRDWLIHFRDQDLINSIFQRVTMENIEQLFSDDYHILDMCRDVMHGALRSLCSLGEVERDWLTIIQTLRHQTLETLRCLTGFQQRGARLNVSIPALTLQTALLPVLHDVQHDLPPSSPLTWLNPVYITRCIELHARRRLQNPEY